MRSLLRAVLRQPNNRSRKEAGINLRHAVGLFCLALYCSCSSSAPLKAEAQQATPNLEQEYHTAEGYAKAGDFKKALPRLKRFVQDNPVSNLTANAYFLMGEIYANSQRYPDALTNFEAVLNLPVATSLEPDATLKVARIQLKLSQPAEAEKTLDRAAHWHTATTDQLIDAEKLRYEALIAQQKSVSAMRALLVVAEKSPNPADRDRYHALGRDTVESHLNEANLEEVADSKSFSFLQPIAKYQYGKLLADRHEYSKAESYMKDAADLAPGTDIAAKANDFLAQMDSRNHVDSHTIGVVLPLSGKQAGIGYKALKGVQLALGIYGKDKSKLRLAVVDSEGNPDSARRAVERLVQEDGALAIIGGLLSKTATAEGAKAQELGVPTIMLSQKSGVTQAGDFVFRNSLTSQMQVQALVNAAIAKMGFRNFAILYPNDAYGVEFANLFWDEVRARGGEVTAAQSYDPQETDFRGPVQRMVGTFYLEDRPDEYRLYSKQWAEKNPKRATRQAPPALEDLIPPIVDFDAIFIPDSAKAVGQIAPMLAYNNVSGTHLLGTNIWNSPSFVSRGQKFVDNAIFTDSFLPNDPTFANSEFATNYRTTFNEEPGLTEVQAYDSAMILRQLISSGDNSRTSLQKDMARLQNFPGAIGRLSANGEREFIRPVEAITVKDGKIMTLEAAASIPEKKEKGDRR